MSILSRIQAFLRRGRAGSAEGFRPGEWGERQAEKLLVAGGLKILGRRVRVGRRDEIDIVARDGEELVFVEVKTRRNENFGRPAAAVGGRKRKAVSRAALRYLRAIKRHDFCFRFDVVEVIGTEGGARPVVIRHIRNAFVLDRRYRAP